VTETVVPSYAHPTTTSIAAHLLTEHVTTGIAATDIATTAPQDLLDWHDADHRHVAPLYLGHTHDDGHHTARPTATDDQAVHQATLKAIRDGKPVGNLPDILARAQAVTARLAAADHADATGQPLPPGGRALSPYDRRCLEIAETVAERALKKARRSGRLAA